MLKLKRSGWTIGCVGKSGISNVVEDEARSNYDGVPQGTTTQMGLEPSDVNQLSVEFGSVQ